MIPYIVREPKTTPSSHTLILLHGYGADEYDLLSVAEYLPPSLKIISLQAPIALPWGGYAWYHLEQTAEGLRGDEASRKASEQFLLSSLPEILIKEEADPTNIILLGFSQGAAMSLALLANDIQTQGVVVLSGYLPKETKSVFTEKKLNALPVFISHGEFDDLIAPSALDETRTVLTAAGAMVTAKLYPMGHSISEEVLDDLKNWFALQIFKG